MPLRYRDHSHGITNNSLRKAHNNLHKLGTVTEIRGYRFTSTGKAGYPIQHEAVLLKGPHGSMRFEGFLWGYTGEGPRGLVQLLKACGFTQSAALTIAYYTERKNEDGVDFVIKLPVPVDVNPNVINVY